MIGEDRHEFPSLSWIPRLSIRVLSIEGSLTSGTHVSHPLYNDRSEEYPLGQQMFICLATLEVTDTDAAVRDLGRGQYMCHAYGIASCHCEHGTVKWGNGILALPTNKR